MSRGHVLVHGLDGVGSRHVPVLLVHVVRARSRVVTNPDAKVLDLQWALLMNLTAALHQHLFTPVPAR